MDQDNARTCPVCRHVEDLESLKRREYHCPQCNLELAHLDIAANGAIRGVFGWLHGEGDIISGRYRVRSVLGKGGFGATYLVEDTRLSGKRRALKEIPALLFDEYEATLLSRLNHPAIPDIIDRQEADGMIDLVLEFGGSRTLGGERQQHPQQRIPLPTLLPWIRQLCDVLAYLHRQDPPIIHRDLKPDNILLDEDGRIMLIDFGIAKESKPAMMTRTLGRAATHGFSPPEQAMGTGTDERSDIYALGATFYALLTGNTPPAAHERIAGKDLVPLKQIVGELPQQLEIVILRSLELNVNHRQQSVAEFARELDDALVPGMTAQSIPSAYGERTVRLSGPTPASATRSAGIRLQTPHHAAAESARHSKSGLAGRFGPRLALAGGAVLVAGFLLASYQPWFGQDQGSRDAIVTEHPAPAPARIDGASTAAPKIIDPPRPPIASPNPPVTAVPQKTEPDVVPTGSAIEELGKGLGKQPGPTVSATPPSTPKVDATAIKKAEEENRRQDEQRRIAAERRGARTEGGRMPKTLTPPPRVSAKKSEQAWLDELIESRDRRQ